MQTPGNERGATYRFGGAIKIGGAMGETMKGTGGAEDLL